MQAKLAIVVAATLVAFAGGAWAQDARDTTGHAILAGKCARCHNIETSGGSPHPQAPPFRTLSQRYPVERLAEALAEGIVTGHPDMPQFAFSPKEIDAILTYLDAISEKKGP
jgi:cytochrome c